LFNFVCKQNKKGRKILAISAMFIIFALTFMRTKCPKSEKTTNIVDKAA